MLKILIADDHETVRQGVKRILVDELAPVHVGEAFDAPSLVEKVKTDEWDLVISDLVMPGGGAFEVLKNMQAEHENIPVIVISTYSADQYRNRVIKAGAKDFISKDTFPQDLLASVKKILSLV